MAIPRSQDVAATKAHDREFFTAFGSLFYHYTNLENQLTCLIRNMLTRGRTGVDMDIAVATISRMTMAPLKDTIKRLMRVTRTDKPTRDFVDGMFCHLGEIQFLRDRLAHHYTGAATVDLDHTWKNEDFASARELDKSQVLIFHTSALKAAAADLAVIADRVDNLMAPFTRGEGTFDLTPVAWLYKPAMLIRRDRKSANNLQSPQPPPES